LKEFDQSELQNEQGRVLPTLCEHPKTAIIWTYKVIADIKANHITGHNNSDP